MTIEDYKVYAKKLFPNTQAVSVWGGEDGSYDVSTGVSSTPEYGKVFISIKNNTGQNLSTTQKNQLVKDFAPFKVASVTPVIVDADTTFLILGVSFQYDSNATTLDKSELGSLVFDTIKNYNSTDLLSFNNPFRHSKLTGLIDDTDDSILSNITTVTMAKLITPTTTTTTSYTINFNNALYHPLDGYNAINGGVIASTGFFLGGTTEYFFDDDGSGKLRIYYLVQAVRTYFDLDAGSVDYDTGVIKVDSILITSVGNVDEAASTRFRLTAIPNSNDIVPVRNQILEVDVDNTTVNGSIDSTATTGKGYTTTTVGTTTTTTVSTTPSNPTSSSY